MSDQVQLHWYTNFYFLKTADMGIGVSYTSFHADSKYVIKIFVARQDFLHFDISCIGKSL